MPAQSTMCGGSSTQNIAKLAASRPEDAEHRPIVALAPDIHVPAPNAYRSDTLPLSVYERAPVTAVGDARASDATRTCDGIARQA